MRRLNLKTVSRSLSITAIHGDQERRDTAEGEEPHVCDVTIVATDGNTRLLLRITDWAELAKLNLARLVLEVESGTL
jgi:hypothetical protein